MSDNKKYYLVDFGYQGPMLGPEDPESNKAASEAEKEVGRIFKENGITFRHEYTWPDGSLFKWIYTEKSVASIHGMFQGDVYAHNVQLVSKDRATTKDRLMPAKIWRSSHCFPRRMPVPKYRYVAATVDDLFHGKKPRKGFWSNKKRCRYNRA